MELANYHPRQVLDGIKFQRTLAYVTRRVTVEQVVRSIEANFEEDRLFPAQLGYTC